MWTYIDVNHTVCKQQTHEPTPVYIICPAGVPFEVLFNKRFHWAPINLWSLVFWYIKFPCLVHDTKYQLKWNAINITNRTYLVIEKFINDQCLYISYNYIVIFVWYTYFICMLIYNITIYYNYIVIFVWYMLIYDITIYHQFRWPANRKL